MWTEEEYYVFCAGRYKLINQKVFQTKRKQGTRSEERRVGKEC